MFIKKIKCCCFKPTSTLLILSYTYFIHLYDAAAAWIGGVSSDITRHVWVPGALHGAETLDTFSSARHKHAHNK